jgi:hypothetical protein
MNPNDGAELTDERTGYWLSLDGWTAREAFALLKGLDPDAYFNGVLSPRKIRIGKRTVIVASGIEEHATDQLFKLLERAGDAGRLNFPAKPTDVIAWAKSKTLKLPRQFVAQAGAGRTAKPEWMRQAWEIGTEWMRTEEKRTGKRPTVVAIAKHVEGELSTRGITGTRGKYLDWESIKRNALTGITGRVKGDNFKNAKGNPHRKKKSPIVKA